MLPFLFSKPLISVLLILDCVFSISSTPSIFTETSYGAICTHKLRPKKKPTKFKDKLWSIKSRDFILHFSFCDKPQAVCQNKTANCLIQTSNNDVINIGSKFERDSEYVLKTVGGEKCKLNNQNQNYTLKISFDCYETIKTKPRLLSTDEDDECLMEVSMMRPTCLPRCAAKLEDTYIIDIRKFSQNILIGDDSQKFSLSICSSNTDCGEDFSACELFGNKTVPLAEKETQSVWFDVKKNELTAKAKYKVGNKVIRQVEVLIKCNWTAEVANPVYKRISTSSNRYRFELESSYGCVKIPPKCSIQGAYANFHYDLNGLDRENGWLVKGTPEGTILLNLCAPLLSQSQSICEAEFSQICHIYNGKFMNRGSILLPFKFEGETIIAHLISGSTCLENSTLFYTTRIEFVCSKSESGPIFQNFNQCEMMLKWETPYACPSDIYKSDNCYISDWFSNRNFQNLYSQTDMVKVVSDQNTMLAFNLCGALHKTCNNYDNAAFCLSDSGNDIVLGFDNRDVVSSHGIVQMEFRGEMCPRSHEQSHIFVAFRCAYGNMSTEINVVEDRCKYNLTVNTQIACASQQEFTRCDFNTQNGFYDLSSLVSKKNYLISTDDVDYVLNVCGPIITEPGALCKNSMICQYNRTSPNIKYQYLSLGTVASPSFQNDTLVIESKMGSICANFDYYKSLIRFYCSEQDEPPKFISKNGCLYNFEWKTRAACPQEKKCIFNNSNAGLSSNILEMANC